MNTVSVPENAVLKEPRAGFWRRLMTGREEQVFLILTLIIGAVVGLIVVAFVLLTERFGARLYPVGGAVWRRVLIPTIGSLGMGYLLFRFFPDAPGKRSSANEGGVVRARGPYFGQDNFGKVLLHIRHAGKRNTVGKRRPIGASRCGHCVGAWTEARAESCANEVADPSGSRGGDRCRV
jgi:hypothetical protein